MKKILSMIGALTLVGGSVAPVAACENQTPKTLAQKLIDKINGANITVPSKTPITVSDPQTQTAIRNSLAAAKSLTPQEASELSFSGTKPLVAGQKVKVNVTATVNEQTKQGMIEVTLDTNNPAQDIINKIKNTSISVPFGTKPSVTIPATVTALNTALQKANKDLTNDDLQKLSYSGGPISSNPLNPSNITVKAKVDKATATKTLTASIKGKPSGTAKEIIDKINIKNITISPSTPSKIDNSVTITALNTALTNKNPTLSEADVQTLSYTIAGGQLVHGLKANQVTVTSTVKGKSVGTSIQVTYPPVPKPGSNAAEDIINKIKDTNIKLFYKVNPDTANPTTINILLQQLQALNPTLLDQDLTGISFEAKILTAGSTPNTLKVTAKEGTYIYDKNIQVTLPSTQGQTPSTNTGISALIKIKNMVVKPDFPPISSENPKAFRQLVQQYNPWIPTVALSAMTFNGNLVAGTAVAVTVYINKKGASDPEVVNTIHVKISKASTPTAILANLKVLKIAVRTGTNPDTSNPDTVAALRQTILDDNSALGADNVKTFTFSKATLSEASYSNITITSTVSGQPLATKIIQVKIYLLPTPSGRIEGALGDSSYKRQYYLNSHNNPDVTNATTKQNLFNVLRWNNSATGTYMEPSDESMITFSGGSLVAGTPTPITVTITPRYGTKVITKTINVTLQKANPTGYKPILAPFVDATAEPTYSLKTLSDLNVKGATMAFIQSNGVTGGKIKAVWGGIAQLGIDSQTEQVLAINQNISDFQQKGGQVAISFGGANGTPIWDGSTTAEMTTLLEHVVDKFKPSRLDFDIEGAEMSNTDQLVKLSQALNAVQAKYPNLLVSLTVAVIDGDSGINPNFEASLKAMGNTLNKMPILNGMTMDYGTPRPDMAEAGKTAINLMLDTASKLFAKAKYNYSPTDLLKFAGFTPMLGINDTAGDIYTKYNAIANAHWANENQVRMFSFWDANSDYPALNPFIAQASWQISLSNSGLWQEPGDFSSILRELFYQQSYS